MTALSHFYFGRQFRNSLSLSLLMSDLQSSKNVPDCLLTNNNVEKLNEYVCTIWISGPTLSISEMMSVIRLFIFLEYYISIFLFTFFVSFFFKTNLNMTTKQDFSINTSSCSDAHIPIETLDKLCHRRYSVGLSWLSIYLCW